MHLNIHYEPFFIDERPLCIWDYDLPACNRSFVKGIDPKYFDHLVSTNEAELDGDNKQYAATLLRTAYTHALETLFALLGASVQAPNAMAAWMTMYSNRELDSVVEKISKRETLVQGLPLPLLSWDSLAVEIHRHTAWHDDNTTAIRFGKLWSRLAREYLSEHHQHEYNNFKHGLRPTMGGFSLSIGKEVVPGEQAPPENMRLLERSEFGSTFLEAEALEKPNYRLVSRSVNWHPRKHAFALQLIAMSIGNVLSWALTENGEPPDSMHYCRPTDHGSFEAPWNFEPSRSTFSMNDVLTKDMVELMSKTDIEKALAEFKLSWSN